MSAFEPLVIIFNPVAWTVVPTEYPSIWNPIPPEFGKLIFPEPDVDNIFVGETTGPFDVISNIFWDVFCNTIELSEFNDYSEEWIQVPCTSPSCRGKKYGGQGFLVTVRKGEEVKAICNECFCK